MKRVDELRRLLAARFPESNRPREGLLRTGIPDIDRLGGGLPKGGITEIVSRSPSCGGHSLLAWMLEVTRQQRLRVGWVDASDSFDPASFEPQHLAHLIWVRCRDAEQALQAVDILVRDTNFAIIALDLRQFGDQSRQRISPTLWYRLQRAVASGDGILLVQTDRPSVPSARLRLELHQPHTLEALGQSREQWGSAVQVSVQRQRAAVS